MSDLGLSPIRGCTPAPQPSDQQSPAQVAPPAEPVPLSAPGERSSIPDIELTPSTLMHDMKRDVVGVVMEVKPRWVFLRPVGGGLEWQALPEDLEPVDRAAELSARVAEVNRRSRERL